MNRDPIARRAGAHRGLAAALAVAALVAAAPAAGQQRGAAPKAGAPHALTAAAVPLPPPPPGTTLRPRGGGWLGVAAGAWVGFDVGSSIALQVDYGVDRTPATWRRLALEYRLAVLLARPAEDTDLTRSVVPPYGFTPVDVPAGVEQTRAWVVEVVPGARVRLAWERFALFADAGLGLAQTIERRVRDEMFAGRTTATENVTGLAVRGGAGMTLDLSPRTRLTFQPVALSLQLGPSYSAYLASLGLSYRL